MKPMAHLNLYLSFMLFLSIGFLSSSSGLAPSEEATSIGSSPVQSPVPYRGDFAGLAKAVGPVVVNISTSQVIKPSRQESPTPL
jgi:hypothetical protein